jgi:hypothetical protein
MTMTKPTSEQVTFLAAGSGATQRTALEKFRDVVSVQDFGAVGDSVTDDTAAIQAAVDSVIAAGGGTLRFPRGRYRVTSTISANVQSAAIHLEGDSILFTTTGTVIDWRGGNNDIVFDMPGYGCISNMFINNANLATNVTAVAYAGTSAPDNRARGDVSRVYVNRFAIGFLVDWSWNINFHSCAALYCGIGYNFRTEANACTLTGCSTNFCDVGISDNGGSGSRGLVWTGGSIENSTVAGIDFDASNVSNSWQFNGTYFEANYRSGLLDKNISITEPFINGDGGGGAREPFAISGSRGIRIENAYTSGGVVSLVDFTGTDIGFVGNSVFVTENYPNNTLPKSLYDNPDSFRKGWLDQSCYVIVETDWLDASGAQLVPISLINENAKLRGRALIGAQLVVRTQIVVSGTATFGIGRSGPGFDEIAAATYNANIAVGVHDLTIAFAAPVVWFPETFAYFASGTAETSGSYKIVAYFA